MLFRSEGGTNAASAAASYRVTFDAAVAAAVADPLILSFSGAALKSTAAASGLRFELDANSSGTEHPLYWISGAYTGASSNSGYAFLTKSATVSGITSLYATFDEIAKLDGTNGGASDGVITAAELGSSARLWVDAGTPTGDAQATGAELLALPDGFKIILPAAAARPADGGIVPSAEAAV